MTTEPIVKTIQVSLAPQAAFDLFTRRMSEWWPLGRHSVSAGQEQVAQSVTIDAEVGGELIEIDYEGNRQVWGHVVEWQDGVAFAVTWHPGKSANEQTRVRVSFEAEGGGTLVTLTHSGWEALSDGATLRNGYNSGWDGVLNTFLEAA